MKKGVFSFVATMVLLGSAEIAVAAPVSIALNVEYRDFLYSGTPAGTYNGLSGVGHPDFENVVGGLATGLVQPTLSPAGVPLLANGQGQIQSAASFSQWFVDTPGINTRIDSTIALTNVSGNTYQFSSSSFFPLDGLGFGNQGAAHNYSFTAHVGWVGAVTDLLNNFTFTGDDDVWVFANGKLLIDLGGVHGSISKSVSGADLLALAGAGLGEDIDFDLFFAERHTVASNFTLTTDIAIHETPEPDSLLLLAVGLVGAVAGRRYLRKEVRLV